MPDRLMLMHLANNTAEAILQLFEQIIRHANPNARRRPLCVIAEVLQQLDARTAVVQTNVQDPDFLAEHEAYYAKWSTYIPRFCTRVHFFSAGSECPDVLDAIDDLSSGHPQSYLGFVTLRPISVSPVGATILCSPPGPRPHFLISKDDFEVNLAGRTFRVKGTPFMQQDNAVGACAQASIWMALRTLRRKEGHAAHSPAQITDAATRFLLHGRTLPNRTGLSLDQIYEAIRSAGYSPHAIPLRDPSSPPTSDSSRDAQTAIYPYVESGIPVILALLSGSPPIGHAVVVIGHGWTYPDLPTSVATTARQGFALPPAIYDASQWATPLLIHNDNTGPYRLLPANPTANEYSLADAVQAIPLLAADVYVDGAEAQEACINLLGAALALNSGDQASPSASPPIVVRTYLQDRAVFRRYVTESDMVESVKRYYRAKWFPRRVWVMEINALDGYDATAASLYRRLGEVIIDCASEPTEGHFLAIHLTSSLLPHPSEAQSTRGVIIDRDALSGDITANAISDDVPYSPFLR